MALGAGEFVAFRGLDDMIHADTMLFILGLTFFVSVIAQTRLLEGITFSLLRRNQGAILADGHFGDRFRGGRVGRFRRRFHDWTDHPHVGNRSASGGRADLRDHVMQSSSAPRLPRFAAYGWPTANRRI